MTTARYIYWQDGEHWLGYFEEYPDYVPRVRAWRIFKKTSRICFMTSPAAKSPEYGRQPSCPSDEAAGFGSPPGGERMRARAARRPARLVSQSSNRDVSASSSTHRSQRKPGQAYSEEATGLICRQNRGRIGLIGSTWPGATRSAAPPWGRFSLRGAPASNLPTAPPRPAAPIPRRAPRDRAAARRKAFRTAAA